MTSLARIASVSGSRIEAHTEEDEIQKCIGSFGRWHFGVVFALVLIKFPLAWHQLVFILIAPTHDFSCADKNIDRCSENCTKHVFKKDVFKSTIISEWDLVCSKQDLKTLSQTMIMLGIVIGNFIFSYLADRYGRRTPLLIAICFQIISGAITALMPWYWAFLICRFCVAVAIGGTMISSFVLIMEFIGKDYRNIICPLYQLPFNIGHAFLAVIGYFLRDWKHIQLAISLPSFILLIYFWIIPESPRWLLAVGKTDKAIKIIKKIAKHNRLPTSGIDAIIMEYAAQKALTLKSTGKFCDLFATKTMRFQLFCCNMNWAAVGFMYFGMADYIDNLEGNFFLNVGIAGLCTIPGVLLSILVLKKQGGKNTIIITTSMAGVASFSLAVVEIFVKNLYVETILVTLSIFFISFNFSTIYLYTGELFPTTIRNMAVGLGSISGRIGCLTAAYVYMLGNFANAAWVRPLLLSIPCIVASILTSFLPDTRNSELMDTMEDFKSREMHRQLRKLRQRDSKIRSKAEKAVVGTSKAI